MSLKIKQEKRDEMRRQEQVGEGEGKKDEFMGIKLKRGVLVGRRGGNTTPSPPWRFGLSQEEASQSHDLLFPCNIAPRISARKLAAELWEVHQLKSPELKKGGPRPHLQKLKNKGFELSNQFDEPPDVPQDQPTTPSNMKKCTTELLRNLELVERSGHALQSVSSSPGSSGAMEIIPNRPVISPNESRQSKGKFRQSSNNIKTSTELLRVLNRIWSLEEQNRSNVIFADTMKNELDQARTLIKVLVKEKKRYHQETEELMKEIGEDKVASKDKEQYQIQSLKEELEDERKMRKHSESLHRKLGRELSEVKSCFSNALKEAEREKKARLLLEDLCDEFAKGIRDYEQEMRALKHKSSDKDIAALEPSDRLILHFAEAWLDERIQMELEEAQHVDKKTILDKLILEIEAFLQARKSTPLRNKKTAKSARSSKESFHLNDAGSTPRNENDKEDSADSEFFCGQVERNNSVRRHQKDHSLLHSEYQKYHHASKSLEISHDPSSPVERWTSVPDLDASESSSRRPLDGVKEETTLKAKLLEARLESQQSRSRGGP